MRKLFLVAACALITQVLLAQPAQETSPQKLKLLSWNIRMLPCWMPGKNSRRAALIGRALASSDYDVIVFQEAFCPLARKKLKKLLDKNFPYQAGPANRRLLSLKTNSGLWILSRYPIHSQQSIIFKNRQGMDALSRKGALLVEMDVHGQRVQVAGTHLQNSGGQWLRHAQCVEFYERLLKPNATMGTAQIICGDFNIIKNTSNDSYQFMLHALGAIDGDLSGKTHFTFDRLNNDLGTEKGIDQDLIDYILIRENGTFIDCLDRQVKVIRARWNPHHEDLSDHYSMEAEIQFVNSPAVVLMGR